MYLPSHFERNNFAQPMDGAAIAARIDDLAAPIATAAKPSIILAEIAVLQLHLRGLVKQAELKLA